MSWTCRRSLISHEDGSLTASGERSQAGGTRTFGDVLCIRQNERKSEMTEQILIFAMVKLFADSIIKKMRKTIDSHVPS